MSARLFTKGPRATSDQPAQSTRRAPGATSRRSLEAVLVAALAASMPGCLLDSSGRGEETPGAGGSGAGTTQTGGGDTTGTGGDGGDGASTSTGGTTGSGGTTGTGGTTTTSGTGGGPLAGDLCPGLSLDLTPFNDLVIGGDTTGAADDYASQICGGAGGADLVYAITTPVAGTLTLALDTAGGSGAVAYLRSACDAVASILLCTPPGAAVGTSVSPGTHYVFVDGQAGSSPGPFNLTLSLEVDVCGDGYIGPNEECDDGNGQSGDGCNACQVVCDTAGMAGLDDYAFEDADTHHCYLYVFAPNEPWAKARDVCQEWGGDLAALSTVQEIGDVADLLAEINDEVWIGGSDMAVEGSFQWVNGEVWTYQNGQPPWDDPVAGPAEPSGGTLESCLEIYPNGELNDAQCGLQQSYLCERPPAGK